MFYRRNCPGVREFDTVVGRFVHSLKLNHHSRSILVEYFHTILVRTKCADIFQLYIRGLDLMHFNGQSCLVLTFNFGYSTGLRKGNFLCLESITEKQYVS